MKILHTADLHLRSITDVRWQALERVVELAQSENVRVLAISGDLFDSDADGQTLRPKIREVFERFGGHVLIIPGNHDANAYPDGTYFGDNVTVLRDLLMPESIDGVFFWGFPYEEMGEEEILPFLTIAAERAEPDATHVLLFHGELYDMIGGWAEYGEEGRQRYLPVKLSYFQRLPWQYVLAGHFHSNYSVHEIQENQYFVYSGSPVSVTRRETGIRKVNLFTIGEAPQPRLLNSFYYHILRISLDPFEEKTPLQTITERMVNLPEHAGMLLHINGFINSKKLAMSETELREALLRLVSEKGDIASIEFRDVHEVLENDLFKRFRERLDARDLDDAEKQRILDVTVKAMMEINE